MIQYLSLIPVIQGYLKDFLSGGEFEVDQSHAKIEAKNGEVAGWFDYDGKRIAFKARIVSDERS